MLGRALGIARSDGTAELDFRCSARLNESCTDDFNFEDHPKLSSFSLKLYPQIFAGLNSYRDRPSRWPRSAGYATFRPANSSKEHLEVYVGFPKSWSGS
jgi:hypothetical protein